MKKILPVCIVIVVVFALPAFACAEQRSYIVGKLGSYTPESSDLDGFSSDFAGEIAFGHYFNRNFALELGVGHFQTSATFFDFYTNSFFTENIDTTYVDATAKAVYPVEFYNIDLYAGAGAGVYFSSDEIRDFGLSQDDTAAGFHLLGGGDFYFNRNIFFGLETKYIFVRPFHTSMDGLIFTGNIGYRF